MEFLASGEFEASMATKSSHKVTCDVDSASGLEVKHNLVVELIVAEEFVPNKNTQLITPTGAARVLRMQFALIVTERAGYPTHAKWLAISSCCSEEVNGL